MGPPARSCLPDTGSPSLGVKCQTVLSVKLFRLVPMGPPACLILGVSVIVHILLPRNWVVSTLVALLFQFLSLVKQPKPPVIGGKLCKQPAGAGAVGAPSFGDFPNWKL